MDKIKVINIQKRVYANNDEEASILRKDLEKNKTFVMNLMSSPGSGKTTMLVNTINRLKEKLKIAIIEADIDSDVDAYTILNQTGVTVNQLHSGGMCHLDCGMAKEGLEDINYKDFDFVVIENIGNLICPASYDLGQALNTMILSVPEGDDKPLKYPKMFTKVDCLLVSKIDTVTVFDFDFKALEERVRKLNPNINIFPISAKTNEGMDEWCDFLLEKINNFKRAENK
ncbi:MAG: hydrogenase accessory protein HypB [Tenericutes bacterium HGW-Tenericutes-5]|nr:MAG: hydrogenase accessory protein HypB [Tenericutes bacterium HGW-Tenericutes-5]